MNEFFYVKHELTLKDNLNESTTRRRSVHGVEINYGINYKIESEKERDRR